MSDRTDVLERVAQVVGGIGWAVVGWNLLGIVPTMGTAAILLGTAALLSFLARRGGKAAQAPRAPGASAAPAEAARAAGEDRLP